MSSRRGERSHFFSVASTTPTREHERSPDAMSAAMQRHDELLRSAIEGSGGYVFTASYAAIMQCSPGLPRPCRQRWQRSHPFRRALAAGGDPQSPDGAAHRGLRGATTATISALRSTGSARLEAAAHGGQVLVSHATAEPRA